MKYKAGIWSVGYCVWNPGVLSVIPKDIFEKLSAPQKLSPAEISLGQRVFL